MRPDMMILPQQQIMMTPKQRVLAAMNQEPVDRVPVFPVVTAYFGSRVLGRKLRDMAMHQELIHEGLSALHRRFGFDGFEIGFGPPRGAQQPRTSVCDGITYLLDARGVPTARLPEDDMPVALAAKPLLENKRDLDRIPVKQASSYVEEGYTDSVTRMVETVGQDAFVAGVAAGQTMNSLAAWRGSDQALVDLTDDPIFVREAMERATDISIEAGKALIQAGVDGIYIGDAWASPSIISPAMYERFCLPCHHRAARAFQSLGVKVYLHICGNSEPILGLMADTGVDAVEPLDVDGGVRLERVRRAVGDRVCLKGGVSTLLLLRGTPEEVYAESTRCIEVLGPTGYILGSADDIPRDAPFENIEALVKAGRDAFRES